MATRFDHSLHSIFTSVRIWTKIICKWPIQKNGAFLPTPVSLHGLLESGGNDKFHRITNGHRPLNMEPIGLKSDRPWTPIFIVRNKCEQLSALFQSFGQHPASGGAEHPSSRRSLTCHQNVSYNQITALKNWVVADKMAAGIVTLNSCKHRISFWWVNLLVNSTDSMTFWSNLTGHVRGSGQFSRDHFNLSFIERNFMLQQT